MMGGFAFGGVCLGPLNNSTSEKVYRSCITRLLLLLLLKGQVLFFYQTAFMGLLSFSERMDNKQREKNMKTSVHLGIIILMTIPILLTRTQLANMSLTRNYLFFFYDLLPLYSLVSWLLRLFFKKNWNVSLWPWQQGFKGLKDALFETHLCRY